MTRQFTRVLVCCLVPAASAEILDPAQFMTIEVSNSSGQGTYSIPLSAASNESGSIQWQMDPGPVVITDDSTGAPIATLASSSFQVLAEPRARVEFSFGLLAGDELTTIVAQSPQISTGGQAGIQARSTVNFDLTDGNDGVAEMVSAATPVGIGAFRSRYNGAGTTGNTFSHMIYRMGVNGGAGSTLNVNKNFPNFGFASIVDTVEDMSMDMSFTLTPGDLIVATGSMELNVAAPEPASWMLAMLGVGLVTRRR